MPNTSTRSLTFTDYQSIIQAVLPVTTASKVQEHICPPIPEQILCHPQCWTGPCNAAYLCLVR